VSQEGSPLVCTVTCSIGPEEQLGGVSWNKTQRQLALIVGDDKGEEVFALGTDHSENIVARDSKAGDFLGGEKLVERFVRRLTKVPSEIEQPLYIRKMRAFALPDEE
jgi:hypothetical protein